MKDSITMVERKDSIRNAYRFIGSNGFYDGMITCSTFLGRVVSRLVWDMNADDCAEYQTRALSGIPERFSGRLLEVPVGTGILTMPVYQTLPAAKITCVDYSPDMMTQAETKAKRLGLKNIAFKQADVGNMPFEGCSFDVVVSLNGFHAFPDKKAAYKETYRVLKNGGIFCGCFYVKGLCKRTDCIIRSIYQPMKLFVPPYETKDSLKNKLKSIYADVKLSNVKGIACFVCRKISSSE